METTLKPCDTFDITGLTVDGKRFKIQTKSLIHALSINLVCGSVWLCRDGTRKLLKRVSF